MESLKTVRQYVLDMDGTVYLGERLLPGAKEFLDYLTETGRRYLFLTNNSSRDAGYYAEKLQRLGVSCTADNIITSGEATALYLKQEKNSRSVFLLGTPVLEEEFRRHGFTLTDQQPDHVVLGFDTTLTYDKLTTACDLIRGGTPFVATHPDFNCPTESGYIPDCGAMIALIHASTGKTPQIIGKPNKEIVSALRKKSGAALEEMAIVGDRLYTDIATGYYAGIRSILVLSGESKASDIKESFCKPDHVFDHLGALAQELSCIDRQ